MLSFHTIPIKLINLSIFITQILTKHSKFSFMMTFLKVIFDINYWLITSKKILHRKYS